MSDKNAASSTENEAKNCRACPEFKKLLKNTMDSIRNKTMGSKREQECPPDVAEIGRATWTYLHTTAAYYPEKPDDNQKNNARALIESLKVLYACGFCRNKLDPIINDIGDPDVESRHSFSQWMCKFHNKVNNNLGKAEFDCTKVLDRWKDGC
ncbi:MAG: hypothetical protein MHMPM18_001340 [Marteilia pararefringens]